MFTVGAYNYCWRSHQVVLGRDRRRSPIKLNVTTSEVQPGEPPQHRLRRRPGRTGCRQHAGAGSRHEEDRVELFLGLARKLIDADYNHFTVQDRRALRPIIAHLLQVLGEYKLLLALFEEWMEGAAARLDDFDRRT